ncbi:MAG: redox-regulated ATPase YchF, partial [Candidatus Shapirobacteria bacterium]
MSIGIVGLPNVGKSTLFNALLKRQVAYVANYPFATIESNIGVVPVPDNRLAILAEVVKTNKIVPATVKFVDIAGLVKGASQGEGLGNKFLQHIRDVDALAMVLRDFSDENIIRSGSENPESDRAVLETELVLADLATAQKIQNTKDKVLKGLADKIVGGLEKGTPVREMEFSDEEKLSVKQMGFLTSKPVILVINTDENNLANSEEFVVHGNTPVRICAKTEAELSELTEEEQKEYLKNLGIEKSGLELLIQKGFQILGLQTFLTAGEKEVRAWTIHAGDTAPTAAGVIHTDFEKHFIKADCISFEDF